MDTEQYLTVAEMSELAQSFGLYVEVDGDDIEISNVGVWIMDTCAEDEWTAELFASELAGAVETELANWLDPFDAIRDFLGDIEVKTEATNA